MNYILTSNIMICHMIIGILSFKIHIHLERRKNFCSLSLS